MAAWHRIFAACVALAALAGCAAPVSVPPPSASAADLSTPRGRAEAAARNFVFVVTQVEPVAERQCRAQTSGVNCDFSVVVDDRPGQPPNAFQTVDRVGRPVVGFTLSLIAEARNVDELAFILGHEAAHHIAGHLELTRASAAAGARIAAARASARGDDAQAIRVAAALGAEIGARTFSKEFELEADALGTAIAAAAGFDPVRGAQFFARIPDPGNVFLGTHPPNAERIAQVKAVAAGL